MNRKNPLRTASLFKRIYYLMDRTNTYALGVHALRDACVAERNPMHPQYARPDGSSIYRPLTFKEGIQARLTEFETLKKPDWSTRTLDERVKFFLGWNDSCTGIAYQAGTTKFKIVPVCEPLITIPKKYKKPFLAVSYVSLLGVELDSSIGVYNQLLTKQQIKEHKAWRAAVEGDVPLLRNYCDAAFYAIQHRYSDKPIPEKAMGFYVQQNTNSDELRALSVFNLNNVYTANGFNDLGYYGSFVRCSSIAKTAVKQ